MDLTVGDDNLMREYRKGNWTVQETMVLIEAKKMDDQRRMRRLGESRTKPAELRWKWVEDYCWKNGCLRSQNQCNDKWDNLMRDFKKVREYERTAGDDKSYWNLQKNQRKDLNLPSNLLLQIYQALLDAKTHSTTTTTTATTPLYIMSQPATHPHQHQPFSQPADSDSSSENTESAAKRRKRDDDVGSAISKSAIVIAEAIRFSVESEERRHREVLSLQQRRLQIEETKAEINRQAINGLIDAITKLTNNILNHKTS